MRWLKIGIGVLLASAAAFVAHMHVVAQTYYPTVRVEGPEGLTYVLVQDEKTERRDCGTANKAFVERIKAGCAECRIVSARCTRALEDPFERAAHEAGAVQYSTVVAPGMRMAIVGPRPLTRESCRLIAQAAEKQGVKSAACILAAS